MTIWDWPGVPTPEYVDGKPVAGRPYPLMPSPDGRLPEVYADYAGPRPTANLSRIVGGYPVGEGVETREAVLTREYALQPEVKARLKAASRAPRGTPSLIATVGNAAYLKP